MLAVLYLRFLLLKSKFISKLDRMQLDYYDGRRLKTSRNHVQWRHFDKPVSSV